MTHQRSYRYALGVVAAIVVLVAISNVIGRGAGEPAPPGSVHVSGPARTELLAEGATIPDFSAPALGGGVFTWSDYAGSPVVLAVWASWCPHCQAELPRLAALMKDYPPVKLASVTTYIGERRGPSPAEYMKDESLTFPVARDDAIHTLADALGVQSFPTTYFVNSDGTIMRAVVGEIDDTTLRTLIGGLS